MKLITNFTKSKQYQQKVHSRIPSGCHSYSRGDDQFPSFAPILIVKGSGCYVWDLDGNKFLDWGMGLRSTTLGYAYKPIVKAAVKQMRLGTNFTRSSAIEIEAAETLVPLFKDMDMIKFAKNGSTVTTAATKLARAITGRDYIVRCKQHPIFSHDDWFMGNTVMNAGIPEVIKKLTLTFNYNDIASVENVFQKYSGRIACLIMEPVTDEQPYDNFLQKVKDICHKHGALFILDEMITGFRWHLNGAQKYYNVVPDLCTFGKGLSNGFSLAALLGKRKYMERGGLDHNQKRLYFLSSTHHGETHALAAMIEVIKTYKSKDIITHLWQIGDTLLKGINECINDYKLQEYVSTSGFSVRPNIFFCNKDKKISPEFRTLFLQETMKQGVLIPWISPSYSHSLRDVDLTLEAVRKAMKIYIKALNDGIDRYLIGNPVKPVFREYN